MILKMALGALIFIATLPVQAVTQITEEELVIFAASRAFREDPSSFIPSDDLCRAFGVDQTSMLRSLSAQYKILGYGELNWMELKLTLGPSCTVRDFAYGISKLRRLRPMNFQRAEDPQSLKD